MDKENTTPLRENEAAHPQQTTRRTFLKGTTLALPAVITLHSGAALANISVSQCVTQRANTPALPVISPNQDQLGRNLDRKSTRLNSSHPRLSRMPSSA